MKTTMTVKERLLLQIAIYRDLAKDDQRLAVAYEEKMKTESWAAKNYAAANARACTYELVANKLEDIMKDWEEEGDDRK